MSTRPTGTILDDDRLLELRRAEESTDSTLALEMAPVAEHMGASSGDRIDWNVDEYEDEPMLVCSAIVDEQTADAPYPVQLRERDGKVSAPVPDPLVGAEPPEGLGLDLERYDADRPLLFDAISVAETIGFVPFRFDDGEPYRAEPLPGVADESDPVAEETIAHERDDDPSPRPGSVDAPIDAEVLEAVVDETNVAFATLSSVLEELSRQRLVGEADAVGEYPPVAVDDRGVCIVPDDEWAERLGPQLSTDDASALEAARLAHNRQAKRLLAALEDPDTRYDEYDRTYDAIVTDERETAEWKVTEAGST